MSKNQRNGQRKSRQVGSRAKTPDLGYYIIFTDTNETERNYLNGLRDSIPENLRSRLIIKVCKASTAKLIEKTLYEVALNPQYLNIGNLGLYLTEIRLRILTK